MLARFKQQSVGLVKLLCAGTGELCPLGKLHPHLNHAQDAHFPQLTSGQGETILTQTIWNYPGDSRADTYTKLHKHTQSLTLSTMEKITSLVSMEGRGVGHLPCLLPCSPDLLLTAMQSRAILQRLFPNASICPQAHP